MRRLIPLVAIAWVFMSSGSASAGGSPLEVSGRDRVTIGFSNVPYAGAGSNVTIYGRFWSGSQGEVSDGPWFAYLTSDALERQGERILLGSVDIRAGADAPYVAEAAFDAPRVQAGYYWVVVCDEGCSQGVGDLMGGSIVLAPTHSEARLFARALILRWTHEQDARVIERLRKQHGALQAERDAAVQAARQAEARSDEAGERSDAASVQAADAQAAEADAERERDAWRLIGGLAVLLAIAAGVWGVTSLRRVRRLIPESPAELAPYLVERNPSGAIPKPGR